MLGLWTSFETTTGLDVSSAFSCTVWPGFVPSSITTTPGPAVSSARCSTTATCTARRNLAAAVGALHLRGYVIGDVNESNTLVTESALVTLVDTDSFQVRDPQTGLVYRCPVGTPQFTPPELQNKTFAHVDRMPEHDAFGLAVLIFQLLMEGAHPYAGRYTGSGDPPPFEVRISLGHFPHGTRPRGPYRPMPAALPLGVLHPSLQELFERCFVDGHRDPQVRPMLERGWTP